MLVVQYLVIVSGLLLKTWNTNMENGNTYSIKEIKHQILIELQSLIHQIKIH